MPLITLTCSRDCYPEDNLTPGVWRSDTHKAILELAKELPAMVIARKSNLLLTPDTPETAVQVDIKKFHAGAVNNPDLGFRFEFSEPYPRSPLIVFAMRQELENMIASWLASKTLVLSIALDMFFGPTHGFFQLKPGDEPTYW